MATGTSHLLGTTKRQLASSPASSLASSPASSPATSHRGRHLVPTNQSFAEVSSRHLSIKDLPTVFERVKGISYNWVQFSQSLHIDQDTINIIEKENPRDVKRCLNEVLQHWLRRNHDYEKHGIPCWRLVCEAVKKGGEDSKLAEEIAHEYRKKHRQPSSRVAASQKIYVPSERSFKIKKELYELRLKFDDAFYNTKQAFPKELLSDILDYLRSHITALLAGSERRPKAVIKEFQSIKSIPELFDVLQHKYLSWFNYNLIIKLVDKFLSKDDPLKDTWSQYEKNLNHYFMNSGALLKDAEDIPFGEVNSPPLDTKIIVVKVDREDYTLNHLFLLRKALPEKFNIPEYDLYFSYVFTNSLHLEFWVPNCVYSSIFPLSEEQEVGLANLGIVELSDGDGEYSYDLHEKMENSEYESGKSKTTDPTVNTVNFKSKANDLSALATVELELTRNDIKDIILNEMVPCNFFLTTFQGLPYSEKSKLILNFLKSTLHNGVHTLPTFRNDQSCLFMYSVALLRQRPFDEYFWFALTELKAMWCGSAIFRMASLCKYDIQISLNNAPNRTFDEEVLDTHLNEVYQNLEEITESKSNEFQQILSLGAIHMNILDNTDTNRGVKEILTLISQHLNYNLGIICLSIGDIKELNSPALTCMFQESKISCIIRQAVEIQSQSPEVPIKFIITCSEEHTKGHRDEAQKVLLEAITKETARLSESLQVSVLVLDPSSPDDMKKLNIALDKKLPLVKRYIKLSWLFLRDALNDMDEIVILYDKLKDIAGKLGIKEIELKEFLETFTKFMSILYLPGIKSLQDVVILRPVKFITTMSSLFKIPDGGDFNGIYSMEQLNKIIPNKVLADVIMNALCSVGLALKSTTEKIDRHSSELISSNVPLFFVPLARSGQAMQESSVTSLFILFNSKLIQPDCQSFFISELLKLRGSSLLSGSDYHPNAFKISLLILRQEYIFSFIFHGTNIEVVMESYAYNKEFSYVLESIILCCKEALQKLNSKSIFNNFYYKLALQCLTPRPAFAADDYIVLTKVCFEWLLPMKRLCYHCELSDSPLRKRWKEVIQNMYEKEEKKKERVNVEKLIELAQSLGPVIKSAQTLKNLASQLRVKVEQEYIVVLSKSCLPWQRVLMILLMWEKKEEATIETLKSALRRLGYPSVVLD